MILGQRGNTGKVHVGMVDRLQRIMERLGFGQRIHRSCIERSAFPPHLPQLCTRVRGERCGQRIQPQVPPDRQTLRQCFPVGSEEADSCIRQQYRLRLFRFQRVGAEDQIEAPLLRQCRQLFQIDVGQTEFVIQQPVAAASCCRVC